MSKTSPDLVLYGTELSGHTHRVAVLLTLLGLPFRLEHTPAEQRRTPSFLARNPFGQIPVLVERTEEGEVVLQDSNAILVYLARRYDPSDRWLPRDPLSEARVQRWLSVAAGEIAYGPARARLVKGFKREGIDHGAALTVAQRALPLLDQHLEGHTFLAAAHPTIADLAIYAYTKAAPEGEISLAPYRHIAAWFERLEALPGFFPMPKIVA